MAKITLDYTPDQHMLESIRHTKMSHAEGLSELIDNSIDADAKEISVHMTSSSICVEDDGKGCDDLSAMLGMGRHLKTGTTKIGRYGVGLKNAVIAFGDILSIESTASDGFQRKVSIDWLKNSGWKADGDITQTSRNPGTQIKIEQLRKGNPKRIVTLASELAFTFTPAILSGRVIKLGVDASPTDLIPFEIPPLNIEIEKTIWNEDVENMGFKVRGGVIAEGYSNPRKSFIITYAHRVILETDEPCDGYTITSRFIAWVELIGRWPLLKHKDGLSGYSDWLECQLRDLFKPILQELSCEGEAVELEELAQELSDDFNQIIGLEKRVGAHKTEGAVQQSESGKRRRIAEVVGGDGDCERRSGARRIAFAFTFENLGEKIGEIRETKTRVQVTFNSEHEAVAIWRKTRDRHDLRLLAIALYSSYKSAGEGVKNSQLMIRFPGDYPHEIFIKMMSSWCKQICIKEPESKAA